VNGADLLAPDAEDEGTGRRGCVRSVIGVCSRGAASTGRCTVLVTGRTGTRTVAAWTEVTSDVLTGRCTVQHLTQVVVCPVESSKLLERVFLHRMRSVGVDQTLPSVRCDHNGYSL
jgi:hypothetical protein